MGKNYQANEVREAPRTFCCDIEQWCWEIGWLGLICGFSYGLGLPFGATALPTIVGVSVLVHFLSQGLRWVNYFEEIHKANTLQREGRLTEALVVNRWSNYDSEGGTTYELAYQIPGGVSTAHYLGTNHWQWETLPLGSRILVLYVPSQPQWSQVVAATPDYKFLRDQPLRLFPRHRLDELWKGIGEVAIGEQFALPISVGQEHEKHHANCL